MASRYPTPGSPSSPLSPRYPTPGSPSSASGMCPGSPASTRSLDDLLICPICLDEFKEPKTLSCLHSFCYTCLQSCKRPYRRDISCPVCKKVTALSSFGIGALQNDFRIQQIRDILLNRPNSPGTSVEDVMADSEPDVKTCDLCKTLAKRTVAGSHCIQCFMYFCTTCVDKHNSNQLFSAHHVITLAESHVSDTLFCKSHKEHPVRYFCKPCSSMMCTICTIDHNPNHTPEPLEKGIIDKYRQQLHESLRVVHSKLAEVKSRSKYLEVVKQSHQRAMSTAQSAIKDKSEQMILKIREKEQSLLQNLRQHTDSKMRENGMENLREINNIKGTMDALYTDIQKVINGSPQDCLVAYEELAGRMKNVKDTTLPSVSKKKSGSCLRFVPTSSDMDIVLGSLLECSLSDVDSSDDEVVANSPPTISTLSSYSTLAAPSPKAQLNVSRRVSSILNAISPTRKTDAKKIGKVKAFSTSAEKGPVSPSSSTINADDLVAATAVTMDMSMVTPAPPVLSPGPASPTGPEEGTSSGHFPPKLLFKVDQVGGWPGRISSPSSVIFLPDGNLVITECENRLQIFDRSGHSIRIIGWGKIKPQNVVINSAGHLMVTDKKDRCVKVFETNGDLVSVWGAGLFTNPSGIAINSEGNVIVTDIETNHIGIHNPDGSVINQFGSWGSGDYQFNHPTHVVVNRQDQIIVSDSGNSGIKVFDKTGVFLNKFNLQSSKQGIFRRPRGLAIDKNDNVMIADHDNHRISLFTPDGTFLHHILTKSDGTRYPTGLALDPGNTLLALVESHEGILCKDPHHTVKLYQIQSGQ